MTRTSGADVLDPARSAVVEACAGSGKTWLLVSRIVRLLLDGVAPGQILAITFTRKAALEMQSRLHDWLRVLALADDATVTQFLVDRHVPEHGRPQAAARARHLLDIVLTAQPGLAVTTFHGWFLDLLRRAPIEASPGSAALVEQVSALYREAWREFVSDMAAEPSGPVATAFMLLVDRYDLGSVRALLQAFLRHRAEWWAFTGDGDDAVRRACDTLRDRFATDPRADPVEPLREDHALRDLLVEYASLLERNVTKTSVERSAEARRIVGEIDPARAFEALLVFMYTQGSPPKPRALKAGAEMTKRLGQADAERLVALHGILVEHVGGYAARVRDHVAYTTNAALFECGHALVASFQALKSRRGLIDFTDIEWQARQLVTRSEHADYMLHKMDARYSHILVDEFQDTNPLQWQTLDAWIRASTDAGTALRVFVVGDPKQSIYRFRRADARLFPRVAERLVQAHGAAHETQNVSRRCAPPIVDVVNDVFVALGDEFAGYEPHEPHDTTIRGAVEILPLAKAPAPDDASGTAPGVVLRNPLTDAEGDAETRVRELEGAMVASRILDLVGRRAIVDAGRSRAARFSDVMLLVRNRTHLLAFEHALRNAGVPFVTSRRGGLLDRLEIEDLTALLRFLVTPFADLDLARALRSPLFACTDDDLVCLARTPGVTWWERLRHRVDDGTASAALGRAHGLLAHWFELARRLPVHDLLDRIYFEADALRRYRAAVPPTMGELVAANLRQFIELALSLDAGRYPSLPGFLDALDGYARAPDEESPDEGATDGGEDAVRILTVHGAKGLEAPIVFLIDAHPVQRPRSHEMLVDWPPEADAPACLAVRTVRGEDADALSDIVAEDRRQAAREDLNALYVAMTRARQVLVVSGSEGKKAPTGSTWYRLVEAAITGRGASCVHGPGLPEAGGDGGTPASGRTDGAVDPAWLVPRAVGSRGHSDATPQSDRGERIHWLLEQLAPPEPVSDESWLRRTLALPDTAFEEALAAAREILAAPALASFFDPEQYRWARNEVAFVNASGELRRMDRVVHCGDTVWVLDYKTGQLPTAGDLAGAAAPYRDQMREYAVAARALWPEAPVRVALVFSGGILHEVTDQA